MTDSTVTTLEPVTTGGWYERTDGSVGKYTWRSGQLVEDRMVASWSAVPSREEEIDELARALEAV